MGETTRRIRSAGGQAVEVAADGVRLVALADGYLDMDLSRFPDVVRGVGDDMAIADGQDLNDMTVSVNAFLLEIGDRVCLVDAGDGSRRGDALGHLKQALKAAGFDPEDVTDIFMTHLHGDHAAGLFVGETPVYPNASMHVSAVEQAFWNAPEKLDSIQATQVEVAQTAMRVYRERLQTVRPGDSLAPGVGVRALPGHTPGQVGFLVGGADPLLISADALHLPALQIQRPEWGFLFDADRETALATRRALIAEAAGSGLRLAGAHIPFPGVIRVRQEGDALSFAPAID